MYRIGEDEKVDASIERLRVFLISIFGVDNIIYKDEKLFIYNNFCFDFYHASSPDLDYGAGTYSNSNNIISGFSHDLEANKHKITLHQNYNDSDCDYILIDFDEEWENDKLFQISTVYDTRGIPEFLTALHASNYSFKSFINKVKDITMKL